MRDLRNAVRTRVERDQLDSRQLQALDELQRQASPHTEARGRPAVLRAATLGALLMAVLMAVLLLPNLQESTQPLTQRIAAEVVRNHLKQSPLEAQTASLDDLRRHFAELDFRLIDSARLDAEAVLVGGLYCSVQGVTAAQLRLHGNGGDARTLYQAPYMESVFGPLPVLEQGEAPLRSYAKGVGVDIWVEKGVLMVLTE